MTTIHLNGQDREVDAPDDMPLLWAIRDVLGFTGTKFGCGMGLCGACTMHMDGAPIRSCVTPISAAAGKKITTIEALGKEKVGKAVQEAWVKVGVPQCGYCQGGEGSVSYGMGFETVSMLISNLKTCVCVHMCVSLSCSRPTS